MECNKEEALRAKNVSEEKIKLREFDSALRMAERAQRLFGQLDGIEKLISVIRVLMSGEKRVGNTKDWYAILGLDPGASEIDIKKQFRKLALSLHPDKNKETGAEEAFKLIAAASDHLNDPVRKSQFHAILAKQKATPAPRQAPRKTAAAGGTATASTAAVNAQGPKNAAGSSRVQPGFGWTMCSNCRHQSVVHASCHMNPLVCMMCRQPFVCIILSQQQAQNQSIPSPNLNAFFPQPGGGQPSSAWFQNNGIGSMPHPGFSSYPNPQPHPNLQTQYRAQSQFHSGSHGFGGVNVESTFPSNGGGAAPSSGGPRVDVSAGAAAAAWEAMKAFKEKISAGMTAMASAEAQAMGSKQSKEVEKEQKRAAREAAAKKKAEEKAAMDLLKRQKEEAALAAKEARRKKTLEEYTARRAMADLLKKKKKKKIEEEDEEEEAAMDSGGDDGDDKKVSENDDGKKKKRRRLHKGKKSGSDDEDDEYEAMADIPSGLNDVGVEDDVGNGPQWHGPVRFSSRNRGNVRYTVDDSDDDDITQTDKSARTDSQWTRREPKAESAEVKASVQEEETADQADDKFDYDQMQVPDPDFYKFDDDRSEESLKKGEVWAMYDDTDGMPRFYGKILKVTRARDKTFRYRIVWLEGNMKTERSFQGQPITASCGSFREAHVDVQNSVSVFAYQVNHYITEGPGIFRIGPRKGQVWCMFKGDLTSGKSSGEEANTEYNLVLVVSISEDDQDIEYTYLKKVVGFTNIFEVDSARGYGKSTLREVASWFSHLIPSRICDGSEDPKIFPGVLELDPAATPLSHMFPQSKNVSL